MKRNELVQGMGEVGYYPMETGHAANGNGFVKEYAFKNKAGKVWRGTNEELSVGLQILKDGGYVLQPAKRTRK